MQAFSTRTFKRSLSIILTTCLALGSLPEKGMAQIAPQQAFDQANRLYESHLYDSATVLYQQLIKNGFDNPELFYNAGNANFKSRHLGYAVYYFEKALQADPGNKVIAHNLALARGQATDKIDQVPTLFFITWWHQILQLHRPNAWMAVSIVLFWLLVFFTGWRVLRRPAPGWTKWAVLASAVLCCFYVSGSIGSWYRHTHHTHAVIIRADEPLKSAPDGNSPEIMVVHEGLKVKVTDAVNGWRKIKLTDGKEGWVDASSMLGL